MRLLFLLWIYPAWLFAQSAPVCGNGVQDVGERCDDGNTLDGDGCSSKCIPEFCGDKIINRKGEECDDGNVFPDDGCHECKKGTVIESSEESPTPEPMTITPDEAFRRSLVTTLFLTPGLGFIYGPSMGHFAAGETGRALGMSFTRAILLGSAVVIARSRLVVNIDGNPDFDPTGGIILLSLDGLLLTTLVGVDLLDSAKAVERARGK